MGTYAEIQTLRFGTDMVLPGIGEVVKPTASGDWPLQSGRVNLLDAHVRRASVAPGQMVHRPLYGGGLLLFVEEIASPTVLAQMEVSIRLNAFRDPRVADVITASDSGAPGDANRAGASTITLEILPRGEDTTETAALVVG